MNPELHLKIKNNIIKVYIMNFFMMFLVTIPIIVPYWQQFGLTMKEIYQLQAVFGVMMILLDVPAGYFSDLFGRKKCLVAVGVINIFSYQFLLHGRTFTHFVYFEICAALAYSLYSGCDIALIYDSLDAINERSNNEITFLGKRVFYSQLGETIASFLGGLLAVYSLNLPPKINAISAFFPLLIAITLVEPPRIKMDHKNHVENIKFIFKSLFRHSTLLSTLIIFNILYGFATYAAVWAYQAYWKELNVPLSAYGYLWAIFNLTVAIIAKKAGVIEKKFNSVIVVLIVGISPIIAYLGLGFSYSQFGILFTLFFAITRGLNGVVVQDGINARVPSTMRATTNSFCSLGMRAVFFFAGPIIGELLDQKGVHYTLRSLGYLYIVIFFIILIPLVLQRKKFRPL
jgi:MFS family permease